MTRCGHRSALACPWRVISAFGENGRLQPSFNLASMAIAVQFLLALPVSHRLHDVRFLFLVDFDAHVAGGDHLQFRSLVAFLKFAQQDIEAATVARSRLQFLGKFRSQVSEL